MKRSGWSLRRKAALAAAVVGGAAVAFTAGPSRGQQAVAVVHHAAPATVTGRGDARVTLDWALPATVRLQRLPRFRVTDAKGQLIELLPAYPSQGNLLTATGAGFVNLHTSLYLPGGYQVQAEVLYFTADGQIATVASPPTPLTVPAQ